MLSISSVRLLRSKKQKKTFIFLDPISTKGTRSYWQLMYKAGENLKNLLIKQLRRSLAMVMQLSRVEVSWLCSVNVTFIPKPILRLQIFKMHFSHWFWIRYENMHAKQKIFMLIQNVLALNGWSDVYSKFNFLRDSLSISSHHAKVVFQSTLI